MLIIKSSQIEDKICTMQVNKGKKPLFTAMCYEKDIEELKSIFAVYNNNLKKLKKQ